MKSLLVLGFVSLAVLAQQQPHIPENDRNPFAGDVNAIAAGKRLYAQTCQTCHGGDAAGSERGPSLASGVFKHGAKDGEIFLNIRGGIPNTQMPPFSRLSTEQSWQLVSYLRSLASANSTSLPPTVTREAAAAGEVLFFGKARCSACHEIDGRGGITGPDLSAAGTLSTAEIIRKIEDPNAVRPGKPAPLPVVRVQHGGGPWVRGIRVAEDTFNIQVRGLDGHLYNMEKHLPGAKIEREQRSLMPADYARTLSKTEIASLAAFLSSHTSRDLSQTAQRLFENATGLTAEHIENAARSPGDWRTYWGNYNGSHFSPLTQITPLNVAKLQARWALPMPGDSLAEATPLVVDGIMYTTGMPGDVFALDARTGQSLWKFQRKQKAVNPFESNRYNRGVAMLGNRLFTGTLDAALIALDARTGRQLWETQVADTLEGYSITAAPLVVKDKIIVGVAGGEYGIRGFVDAYDAATGKRVWRFYTTPAPGEYGHETWKGDSWKRGGAPTWLTGSYDVESNTLYWATGNPGPDMDAEVRKGDNLFSCSVIALDAATGTRKWHYQFSPNDSHDWDANQALVLADKVIDGKPRKLILQANRNGFFYALDRTNGKFLFAKNYVRQTWNAGFDAEGKPKIIPNTDSSPEGTVVFPGLVGGTNWQSPSYDASKGWLYLSYMESGNRFIRQPSDYEAGKGYWGGRTANTGERGTAGIRAIDTANGSVVWDFPVSRGSLSAGVLATGGGVLFAASAEGNLIALDSKTGKYLWRFQTGNAIASAPMSYAVDGKQYLAVASAGVLYSFALPE